MTTEPLDESTFDPDPIAQFKRWYDDAIKGELPRYDAMTLATAGKDGVPTARMVLLKDVDDRGFVFYTNYRSSKAKELEENPLAALVFYWPTKGRQIRIEGTVRKVSAEDSDAYFSTRDRESQISAWSSSQSEIVESRAELDRRFADMEKKFEAKEVPRPPHWGGYRLKPSRIEFWHEEPARLHDRILYTAQADDRWRMVRLQP